MKILQKILLGKLNQNMRMHRSGINIFINVYLAQNRTIQAIDYSSSKESVGYTAENKNKRHYPNPQKMYFIKAERIQNASMDSRALIVTTYTSQYILTVHLMRYISDTATIYRLQEHMHLSYLYPSDILGAMTWFAFYGALSHT